MNHLCHGLSSFLVPRLPMVSVTVCRTPFCSTQQRPGGCIITMNFTAPSRSFPSRVARTGLLAREGHLDLQRVWPTDIKLSLQTQQLATGSEATAGFHSKECAGVAKILGSSWKSLSNN